ncbi:unnamed protein product [Adineta ricciae]|nr:unnamed protein product [Adineta ricciae]
MKNYFGPLDVDEKKVHISIVGCLRNDRGKQKSVKQRVQAALNIDQTASYPNEIDFVDDDNQIDDVLDD